MKTKVEHVWKWSKIKGYEWLVTLLSKFYSNKSQTQEKLNALTIKYLPFVEKSQTAHLRKFLNKSK